MKKTKGLFIGLISLLIIVSLLVINALYVNPHDLKIREETLISSKIDDKLDGLLIAYFCDVHYGHNFKEEDLENMVTKMSAFHPDLIIFGGDLISNIESGDPGLLKDALSKLEARYGKYAVYGDEDHLNDVALDVLDGSGFIILNNANEKIYVDGSFINVVGIDSLIHGTPDVELAYEGVNPEYFTLAVSHCPDIASDLQLDKTDYILSGHSLGGPVYFPLINVFYRPAGADKYFKGKNYVSGKRLDISNGVSTINKDIRLFADAEIVLYKLKSN